MKIVCPPDNDLSLKTLTVFSPLRTFLYTPERTFMMIKPDCIQRSLIGEIIKRFEAKGLKMIAMKFIQVFFVIVIIKLIIFLINKQFNY